MWAGASFVEPGREVGPWRERVALAAHTAMTAAGTTLLTGAVALRLSVTLPRPKATPKRLDTPLTPLPPSPKTQIATAAKCFLTHF